MRFLCALITVLALSGCNGTSPPAWTAKPPQGPETTCTEPRPEVCAMVYDPVCAALADGARATYASGCNACAQDAVRSYVSGPCPE